MVIKAMLGLLVALVLPIVVSVLVNQSPIAARDLVQSWSTESDGEGSLDVSPDGQFFAMRGGASKALLKVEALNWDAGGSRTQLALNTTATTAPVQTLAIHGVERVAWHPATHLLATAERTFAVKLWDIRTGVLRATLPNPIVTRLGWYQTVESLAFSPDGNYLVYGAEGAIVRLWRVRDGVLLHNLENAGGLGVTISPDNQLFCAAMGGVNGLAAQCWRIADGQLVWQLPSTAVQSNSLAFSPDGRRLSVGYQNSGQGKVDIWRVDTVPPQLEHSLDTNDWMFSVAFSPDSQLLAAGGGPYVPTGWINLASGAPPSAQLTVWRLRDTSAPVIVQQFPTQQQFIHSIAFTPDNQRLLVNGTGSVRLFRIRSELPPPPPPAWLLPAIWVLSLGGWLVWVVWRWWQQRHPERREEHPHSKR